MSAILQILVHTANILGINFDPFEFAGDYGVENNATREKVFELIVLNKGDELYGPTLSELVTPELLDALSEKQSVLTDEDLARFYAFFDKNRDRKLFCFFRSNSPKLLRLDVKLKTAAATRGKSFTLPILSSLVPLQGKSQTALKQNLLDALFTDEHLRAAQPIQVDDASLELFCTPGGQLLYFWLYQALNLHLISDDFSLVDQINRVKESYSKTIGNPEANATFFREKLIQYKNEVLFTQEADTTLYTTLTSDNLYTSSGNKTSGTIVFLKSDVWENIFEVSIDPKIHALLATHRVSKKTFLLASCHGNSTDAADGRRQIQLVREKYTQLKVHHLVIGIDANTKTAQDVALLRQQLDTLGLVGTDVGPTTIKRRMVTVQHAKAYRTAIDEEDYIITVKGDFELIDQTVGFDKSHADPEEFLPNRTNCSDHYPVGAVVRARPII